MQHRSFRSFRLERILLVLLAVALALPALPGAAAQAAAPANAPAPPAATDPAYPILDLGRHPDQAHLDTAVAAFQGRSLGPYSSYAYTPPQSVLRDLHPSCDLNGDGHPDAIVNDFQQADPTRHPGEFDGGSSKVRALSGADGHVLWSVDNARYVSLNIPHGYSNARPGQPDPNAPPDVTPTVDLNHDGVCDVLAFGYVGVTGNLPDPSNPGVQCDDFTTPLVGSPSVSCVDVVIQALDGRNGTVLWTKVLHSTKLDASEPLLGTESTNFVLGFPTGIAVAQTPHGPRLLAKTTDVEYVAANDPLGLTSLAFGGAYYFTTATTGEHLVELNATDGSTVWSRDFNLNPEATHTNITWISGFQDINGDGHPDVVMDQLFLANPRGREALNPLTKQPLYRNGRGMRMLALDGASGATMWTRVLWDPGVVQTAPTDETSVEVLSWNYGTILPDFTGDGRPDVVGQYMTDEYVGGTPNGRHRTHFVPLDGLTGAPLWDHAQQGWGFLTNLGKGPHGYVLAAATLDVPDRTPAGAQFPKKSVNLVGLDAQGTATWSFEAPFAQDSGSSYEIGLHQIHDNLAPVDLDGDGVREVVTPAQYIRANGTDQVFLATARQRFQVLSGATGRVEQDINSWGSNGLLLPCAAPGTLTFAVGHAKRIDLERYDAATGTLAWRTPIWDFAEKRSSTDGMDLLGLAGSCADSPQGTLYGVNMEAFSFLRRYEIVPMFGLIGANGTPVWQRQGLGSFQPNVITPRPPTPSLLETLAHPAARFLASGAPTVAAAVGLGAAGAGLGLLLAKPVARLLRARRRRFDPLGIALMLIIVPAGLAGHAGAHAAPVTPLPAVPTGHVPPPAAAAAAPTPPGPPSRPASAAPSGPPPSSGVLGFIQATRNLHGPDANARLVRAVAAYEGAPDVSERFDENATLTYPFNVGDQDGDGVDDVALDVYCASGPTCYDPGHPLTDVFGTAQDLLHETVCGPYHRLVVVSGGTGSRLWDAPLDTQHQPVAGPIAQCALETVLGTVPLGNGTTGILVYRFDALNPADSAVVQVNHTVYMLDAGTGARIWSHSELGAMARDPLFGNDAVANTILMDPILTTPGKGRTPDLTAGAGQSLFLQGIGYSDHYVNSLQGPPGFDGPVPALDDYQPNEWLARLDLHTGQVLWRANSFLPQAGHSVLPFSQLDGFDDLAPSFSDRYYSPEWLPNIPQQVTDRHWADTACCGDLNGDGVSDPVFTTLEWNSVPEAKVQGPHNFETHVVAFDGATGNRLWDHTLATDIPGESVQNNFESFPYDAARVHLTAVGAADGGKGADVLASEAFVASDYNMTVSLLDGRDGHVAWRFGSPRAQAAIAIGDTLHRGGNDILFFDWFDLEHGRRFYGDYTNVTRTELKLRGGRDGHVLYTASTISAPADLYYVFRTMGINGLPDLDGDGVGDFPVDNPVFLPDQVTLHQISFLSGRDGHTLFTMPATGAFAYPARLPDITGDGRDDLAILSGDANDLWLSYHDGRDGHPLWAHRALALKTSSYTYAVPRIEFLPLRTGIGPHDRGFLVNLHMDVQVVSGTYQDITIEVGNGGSQTQRYLQIDDHVIPQLDAVLDPQGHSAWSYPAGGDPVATRVDGDTPGTVAVGLLRQRAEPTTQALAAQFAQETWVPAASLGVSLVAALAVAVAVRLRRSP